MKRIFGSQNSKRHDQSGERLHRLVMGQVGRAGYALICNYLLDLQNSGRETIRLSAKSELFAQEIKGPSEGRGVYFDWLKAQLQNPDSLASGDFALAKVEKQREDLGVRNERRRRPASRTLGLHVETGKGAGLFTPKGEIIARHGSTSETPTN